MLDALLRWAPRCRFLLLSSAAVYGDPVSLPVSEEHAVAPLSPYGYHKRQCELLCEEFSRIYDLPTVAVRIFSAYGPGLRRQVVWDICAKALGNEVVGLRGTGNESRDFIHAHDVARALALLASAGTARGEVYNLANGEETTIRELAERLVATLGLASSVEFDGAATPGQPLRWRADLGRVASLGFRTEVPLDRGLCETAAWARAELG